MNLDSYYKAIKENEYVIADAKKNIVRLNAEMVQKFAPVKPGWIVEDRTVRIEVKYADYNGEFWVATGIALTKTNEISNRHTGMHAVNIYNLHGLRNTVKIIRMNLCQDS